MSGRLIPPVPFFFLNIALAIQGFLSFHTNCEVICSRSLKNTICSFIGIALDLQIALGSTHFHYIVSSNPRIWYISPSICVIFDFFHQCFIVFYIQVFFLLLVPFSSVAQSCLTPVAPWTAACQASRSITNSYTLLKLMSIESVMSSNNPSSAIPFYSHLQSFPALGSFQMSQFFISGDHSIGVSDSASVLPMNIQD